MVKKLSNFCTYSDLKNLYNKVVPPIHNFEENMITLEKDMALCKQIVERYDEVLTSKASKVAVDAVIDELKTCVKLPQFQVSEFRYIPLRSILTTTHQCTNRFGNQLTCSGRNLKKCQKSWILKSVLR